MGAEQSQLKKLESGLADFRQDYITFFVNGKEHNVRTNGCDPDISPDYYLVDFLRDKLGLTGTKYMCREGGCGACTVTIKSINADGGEKIRSATSCLIPLFACDGFEITTIEDLGNSQVGYNPIQARLVKRGGTQCGFCTPGFIMNMHSIMESNPKFTPADVEDSFDSNICRCTGYRPIIEAFKSLSTNPPKGLNFKCSDIEDMFECPLKSDKRTRGSSEKLEIIQMPRKLRLRFSETEQQWIKVTTLKTLYDMLEPLKTAMLGYRLVAGNTGVGIYKNDGPYQAYIDINDIPELQYASVNETGIIIGGVVTITEAINIFEKAVEISSLVYTKELFNHFRKIAGHSVRNQATLAGNLMLKHAHREFTSDIFVLLESVGATVTIGSSIALTHEYNLLEFLDLDMTGKVILSIHLPSYENNCIYRCFRLGKRSRNSTAYVNAGFLFQVKQTTLTIIATPRICYGGINTEFIHAKTTEAFLQGKPLTTHTLQDALGVLKDEIVPDVRPEIGSQQYRAGLAQSFLYRFFLSARAAFIDLRLQSGAEEIQRGSHTGRQIFDTDRKLWPLNQPVPKLDSLSLTSGEALFINDIRSYHNELFGVFVTSTVPTGRLVSVDATQALMIPGVEAFISAKSIPGKNNYLPFYLEGEEIFAETNIKYYGHPIGLLLAVNRQIALKARSKVIVKYTNVQRPKLRMDGPNFEQELEEKSEFSKKDIDKDNSSKILNHALREADTKEDKILEDNGVYTVKGEFRTPSEYHFHMETQICLCVPKEDGMDVYSSTQYMDGVQIAVADCLNVPHNSINVHVRRLGGAFGAKITKAQHTACAAAIAAHVLQKPVRVALDLETNMLMYGKRLPYLHQYEVKVDERGKILKLDSELWCDTGCVENEPSTLIGMMHVQSCYEATDWNIKPVWAVTNTASNCSMRAPGSAQGNACIEAIMDHIAWTVKRDPLEVRQTNFIQKGDPLIAIPGAKLPGENLLPTMVADLKRTGDYETRMRLVDSFNKNNKWKKRGLAMGTFRYVNHYHDTKFPAFISVYHADATVNVSIGGIEMGQGINTKVAQVVAYTLQIPLEMVRVQLANTITSPNAALTAGSITSEMHCSSAKRACEQLLKKLAPVRKQLGGKPTWQQLITAANLQDILLTEQFQHQNGDLISYDIWIASMVEVEIDVLTGDYKIVRADVIEDAGRSINPLIDVGQIEGGFIMGLGWWLCEELVYDQDTGQLLTNNTSSYKPMLSEDVPEIFNVTLLRNTPNPYGVLASKATGEPPVCSGCTIMSALRRAIDAARHEVGNNDWYQMDGPITPEAVRRLCLTSPKQFTL